MRYDEPSLSQFRRLFTGEPSAQPVALAITEIGLGLVLNEATVIKRQIHFGLGSCGQ